MENSTHTAGLKAEHGWSVWVEWDDRAYLFDAGQSGAWRDNTRHLGIAFERLAAVVLSHGHYDHTGGLPELGVLSAEVPVFIHPDAFASKYSVASHTAPRNIGIPEASRLWLKQQGDRVRQIKEPMELAPGLWLSGAIPRRATFEDVGGPFYLDAQGTMPDPLMDDMALGLMTGEGLVVLLGCAHAGVVNTLEHFLAILGHPPVHTVLGGMHLLNASAERLSATMAAFEKLQVKRLGVAHCTGFTAAAALSNRFAGRCFVPHVGTRLEFTMP